MADSIEDIEASFAPLIERAIEQGEYDAARALIDWRTEEREEYVYGG
jgi:hypothetical protein